MEVWQETHQDRSDPEGERRYAFGYTTKGMKVSGGNVRHRRRDDVWELVRQVLNHSEGEPEYCGHCGAQYEHVGDGLYRRRDSSYPVAEQVIDALADVGSDD